MGHHFQNCAILTDFTFNRHGICLNPVLLREHCGGGMHIEVRAAQVNGLWHFATCVSHPLFGFSSGVSENRHGGYPDQQSAVAVAVADILETLENAVTHRYVIPPSVTAAVAAWRQPVQLQLF